MDHLFWWGGFGPGFHASWFWLLPLFFWLTFGRHARAHGRSRQRTMRRYAAPLTLPPAESDPALEALRDRFARGEIDRAEYEERRATLLSRPATPAARSAISPPLAKPDNRPEWPDLN